MKPEILILNSGAWSAGRRNYLKVRFFYGGRAVTVVWDLRKTRFTPDEIADIMTEQAALELRCEARQLYVEYAWSTKT